jgi:glutamate racemase
MADQSPPRPSGGPSDPRPIGVFDSGVGGLTVARALMDLLPDERIVYFGDTARGPYGPRDLGEVREFTAEVVAWLASAGTKLVVAACNTATAAALQTDPLSFDVPVVGVIAPAVEAAVRSTHNGRIGVIGTEGTIASGAYDRAVAAADPDVKLFSQACPEFVSFVEAGRTTDTEVLEAAADPLAPLVAAGVDTLILGCTHYPLLTGVLTYVMGPDVALDDASSHRFVASGDPSSFAGLAARFLGPRLSVVDVERPSGTSP